jgi:CBS-domain-containing membrane protein
MGTAPLLGLTAEDLMSRDVKTVGVGWLVRDAATHLVGYDVRGVPVVDATGRCVGAFSVSDVARWVADRSTAGSPQPRTCSFQHVAREPGGRETVVCRLTEGACPFQRVRETSAGREVVCIEPHCVPTDWQMVELDSGPMTVGDVMTTRVVSVGPGASVAAMAQTMLDRGVHRLFIFDHNGHPVGVISVDDLLKLLAHVDRSKFD